MPENPELSIRRFKKAKSNRGSWDSHWQDVADYVLPTRSFVVTKNPGAKRRLRIYNSAAPEAAVSLASALDGMLTNTAIRWFEVLSDDNDVNEDRDAQAWLYDTTSRILAYLDSTDSGFATAAHELYLDLVSFGTAVMLVREHNGRLVYQARQLSNIYLMTDDAGDLTDVYREFELPAWEALEEFGDGVSEKCRKMAEEDTSRDRKIKMLHHVYRRTMRDEAKYDGENKPWGSAYIEIDNKHLSRYGGFDMNPYIVARWSRAAEESYGRSPAMQVLPTIRVLNAMAKTVLEAAEMAVRPPVMVSAGTIEGPIRTAPGSIMYVRQGTRDYPQPFTSGARPDIGHEMMAREEEKVEQAFFLDRLRLPDNDRMTATEIMERRQQGLLIASPVLARLYAEWLDPVITRTYEWMQARGMLLPAPEGVGGTGMRVHYVSPMAISRRASQTQGFLQAMSAATPLIQTDPSVLQNLNADLIFRSLMRANNVDPKYLKSDRDVQQARMQQAQQAAMQQQMAMAQQGASAAKDAATASREFSIAGQ